MFIRNTIVPIVDKPQTKASQNKLVDLALKTKSENVVFDMDAVRQAVRLWVLTNFGDRLNDYYWGSNLIALVGLNENEAIEQLSSLDIFWDRMEEQIEFVTVTREKSFVTINNSVVTFSCYIVDDINQHVLVVEETVS